MEQEERQFDRLIGERLRRRRTELGLTQEQLALALELSYQQIQKYESGANRISASRLLAVARRLDVPVGYFCDGVATGATASGGRAGEPPEHAGRQRGAIELVRAFTLIESDEVRLAVAGLVRAVHERAAPAMSGP
ncbi:MAG TPA: helix-turn-helix transcriptional regulator [Geminicoccaceae bacterium]|nr:helix-turn-helix transcriptional regulator [Geminicoccaceae bacterium]